MAWKEREEEKIKRRMSRKKIVSFHGESERSKRKKIKRRQVMSEGDIECSENNNR